MKKIKQLTCVLISLSLFFCLLGCNSDDKESSEEEVVTEIAEENYSLDKIYDFHDISFSIYSGWEETSINGCLMCANTDGFLNLTFDEYDTNEICNEMIKFHEKTYKDLGSGTPEIINVDNVSISKFNWKPNGGYENSYMFDYNNCIYKIEFYVPTEHFEACKMFQNSDEIISSIKFAETNKITDDIEKTKKSEDEIIDSQTDVSLGMKNALSQAKDYLAYSSFSYLGLIDQLEFEKYSHEEAVYGADNCGADWNKQAVEQAKSYIEYSGYSYTGLIEQLEFEQFTHDEAVYGVDNCNADWNEQAAKVAQSYMEYSSFSHQELIDQLIFEGFTEEQAEYGAKSVGY